MNNTNPPSNTGSTENTTGPLNSTPVEAKRRRSLSLKRLRMFEIVSFAVLVVVLGLIQFRIFAAADAGVDGDSLFSLALVYFGAVMVFGALMLRQGVVRYNKDKVTAGPDEKDNYFRGMRLTWFVPVVALAILIPAISVGIFNDDSTNAWGAGGLFALLIVVAFLMSALFAAFIVAPLELIVRGLVGMARGDKSKIGYTIGGLTVAGITAFIFIGAFAVETTMPFPAGSVQALLAIFGIPGGYYVNNEALLWLARAIIVFYVVLFIYLRRSAKREKALRQDDTPAPTTK